MYYFFLYFFLEICCLNYIMLSLRTADFQSHFLPSYSQGWIQLSVSQIPLHASCFSENERHKNWLTMMCAWLLENAFDADFRGGRMMTRMCVFWGLAKTWFLQKYFSYIFSLSFWLLDVCLTKLESFIIVLCSIYLNTYKQFQDRIWGLFFRLISFWDGFLNVVRAVHDYWIL